LVSTWARKSSSAKSSIELAGVVDHDVEAAEGVDRGADGGVGLRTIGHVERDRAHRLRVALDQIGELLWPTGGRDEPVADRENGLGECTAEPSGSAGDEPVD
jgi:hypothetical protein